MSLGDRRQIISTVLSFVVLLRMVSATIVVSPKDVEAPIGATVFFNCSSSIAGADVQWNVHPVGKPMEVIYAYGKINTPYANRFTIQIGRNLHITSVTADDAGTYECRDDYGRGKKKTAELIILESYPTCRSNSIIEPVVTKNTFGVEVGMLRLTCTVQFQGKKAPTLEWKKEGDEKTITAGLSNETRGNLFLYNITIEDVSNVNGSSYYCRTAKATHPAKCYTGTALITGQTSIQDCTDIITSYWHIGLLIIASLLLNTLAAAAIWYLLIHRPEERSKRGLEEAGLEPLKNEKHEEAATDNELQCSSNQGGRRSSCTCSKDAIIFVLLMTIPFCIGLLLWYICVYRKAEKNFDKGERNDNELATFLNRPREMKELEKNIDDLNVENRRLTEEIQNLLSSNHYLNETNKILQIERENEKKHLPSVIDSLKKENENPESDEKKQNAPVGLWDNFKNRWING